MSAEFGRSKRQDCLQNCLESWDYRLALEPRNLFHEQESNDNLSRILEQFGISEADRFYLEDG